MAGRSIFLAGRGWVRAALDEPDAFKLTQTSLKSEALDRALAAPIAPVSSAMPKEHRKMSTAKSLVDRLRQFRADGSKALEDALAAAEADHASTLQSLAKERDEALGRLKDKLAADKAAAAAEVRAFVDEVNQLTNGGPA